MIRLMEKILKEKLPQLVEADARLDFLKFSTAGSGQGKYNKVIFLVFKNGENLPFACLKTARRYGEKRTITEGFGNLSKLNKLLSGSLYEKMFPSPLFIFDDGAEIVFSAESVCRGRRAKNNASDIGLIAEQYAGFQKYLCKDGKNEKISLKERFNELAETLVLQGQTREAISDFFKKALKQSTAKEVAAIPQHGDLTVYNVFIEGSKARAIDCDMFGIVDLAGFDLFHLLIRYGEKNFLKKHKKYFDDYFIAIGQSTTLTPALMFVYYLHELAIKKPEGTDEFNFVDKINDFRKIL